MENYLIIDNNAVINVIVAESAEIATQVTGKEAIKSTGPTPWIGWIKENGEWINPSQEDINE
jgi:hypothetical protein